MFFGIAPSCFSGQPTWLALVPAAGLFLKPFRCPGLHLEGVLMSQAIWIED